MTSMTVVLQNMYTMRIGHREFLRIVYSVHVFFNMDRKWLWAIDKFDHCHGGFVPLAQSCFDNAQIATWPFFCAFGQGVD
jgi:hypothetical protein